MRLFETPYFRPLNYEIFSAEYAPGSPSFPPMSGTLAPGEFLAPPTYICAVSHQFKTKLRANFELYREASEDAKLINGGDVKPVKGRMYYHVFSRVLCILVRTGKRITIRCSLILLKFTPIWCNQSKHFMFCYNTMSIL